MSAKKAVKEALAASTAHGISRAVSSSSTALKVLWSLLFVLFLALFCRSASSLVDRLINITVVKTHESDKELFEFPDLYFCPSLVYSGSIPYTLNESVARTINDEVDRVGKLYDQLYCNTNQKSFCAEGEMATFYRSSRIQLSMPVKLLKEHLLQSEYQSFLTRPYVYSHTFTLSRDARRSLFIHPNNQVCFKVTVNQGEADSLNYRRSAMFAWLFVDPYYADFNYTGARINPIVNPWLNESIPFENWHSINCYHSATSLGHALLIVPRGTYPSLMHETKLKLSAGRSYQITLEMQDNVHSPELYETYCSPYQEAAEFQDQLTGERQEFKSSRAACFYTEMNALLHRHFNCVFSLYPRPWSLRHVPKYENLTELEASDSQVRGVELTTMRLFIDNATQSVVDKCKKQQPCSYKEYSASSTSDKWPRVGKSLASFLVKEYKSRLRDPRTPATAQLVRLAQEINSGNHSAHTEALFQHYISESMIEVDIAVKSHLSPRILISYSYSWVAFLADIGGILGLYIGCSLLTVCEVFELFYHLASNAIKARQGNSAKGPRLPESSACAPAVAVKSSSSSSRSLSILTDWMPESSLLWILQFYIYSSHI